MLKSDASIAETVETSSCDSSHNKESKPLVSNCICYIASLTYHLRMNAQQRWSKTKLQAHDKWLGVMEALRENRRVANERKATRLANKANHHDNLAREYRTMQADQNTQTTQHRTARDAIRAQRTRVQRDIAAINFGAALGAPVFEHVTDEFEVDLGRDQAEMVPDPPQNLT